jgi:hypothetical protein
MEVSSNVPSLGVVCLMSFIPIIPCIVMCQRDFYAIAWEISSTSDREMPIVKIRKKTTCIESVSEVYHDINTAYIEIFQDSDPENDSIVWKERLVLKNQENNVITSSWLTKNALIDHILDIICNRVNSLIPTE